MPYRSAERVQTVWGERPVVATINGRFGEFTPASREEESHRKGALERHIGRI